MCRRAGDADRTRVVAPHVLADRRVLLVLDDARDEAQLRDLLPGNADGGVIVTARGRLPGLAAPTTSRRWRRWSTTAARQLFRPDRRAGRGRPAPAEGDAAAGGRGAVRRAAARVADRGGAARAGGGAADRGAGRAPGPAGAEAASRTGSELARTIGAGLNRLDADARAAVPGPGPARLPQLRDCGRRRGARWGRRGSGGRADPAGRQLGMVDSGRPAARYRFHDLTREYARAALGAAPGPGRPRGRCRVRPRACSPWPGGRTDGSTAGTSRWCTATTPDWAAPAGCGRGRRRADGLVRGGAGQHPGRGRPLRRAGADREAGTWPCRRTSSTRARLLRRLARDPHRGPAAPVGPRATGGARGCCWPSSASRRWSPAAVPARSPAPTSWGGRPSCWPRTAATGTARRSPSAPWPTRCAGAANWPGRCGCSGRPRPTTRPAATAWAAGRRCASSARRTWTGASGPRPEGSARPWSRPGYGQPRVLAQTSTGWAGAAGGGGSWTGPRPDFRALLPGELHCGEPMWRVPRLRRARAG